MKRKRLKALEVRLKKAFKQNTMNNNFENQTPKEETKKFNFEKHVETPEEVEPEIESQEKFEQQCIDEAERLEVGLGELQTSIDEFGGPEELQKHLEKTQEKRQSKIEESETLTKRGAMIGGLLGIIAAGAGVLASASVAGMGEGAFTKTAYNFVVENHMNISGMTQRLIENPELIAAAIATVPAVIGGIVGSIKGRFKKKKLIKEQDIDNLTGKMAGIE